MSHAAATPPPQTPAQWAVRWHGLVLTAVLLASVPLVHVLWHGVLGEDEPLLRTRSQLPAPVATVDNVFDGSWMLTKERQLREDSPVVWSLRSHWNELRYHAGVPQSEQVHFGKDEWFFIQESVAPDRAAFDRAQPARRAFLREVRDLVQGAGAQFFMVIVPDKARVYPELCYGEGGMPPGKRDNYAAILADLAAVGIPTVDLAAAMAAERAANPSSELYYRRDTHWRPAGALVGGRTVAAALEQRFGSLLPPRVPMELSGVTSVRLIGDLPANMGIATLELPDPQIERRTAPFSLLADHLAEVREYYGLEVRANGGRVAMDGKDANAAVWVIGTSFSEENGANALSLFLGRPVRTTIVRGAVGLEPLRAAVPELRAGTKAKVVIWELVERGMFDPVWREQKL